VEKIIDCVKTEAMAYFKAIDMSITTSRDGIQLSQDIQAFCQELLQADSADDLRMFIDDMHGVAQRAQKDAEDTLERFRSIRRGLKGASSPSAFASFADVLCVLDYKRDSTDGHPSSQGKSACPWINA
jgi:hypothetical protein